MYGSLYNYRIFVQCRCHNFSTVVSHLCSAGGTIVTQQWVKVYSVFTKAFDSSVADHA